MNPKDDNQTTQRKYFDVAPPGKAPASSNSRQYYSDKPPVKDFDFSDKPADAPILKSDTQDELTKTNSDKKPGAPEITSQPDESDESSRNTLDLDEADSNTDLSKIQSEFNNSDDSQHHTDFRPSDFETSAPSPDDLDEMSEDESIEQDVEPEKERSGSAQKRSGNQSSSKQKSESSNKASDSSSKQGKADKGDITSERPQSMPNTVIGEMVVSQHSKHGTGRLLAELFAVLVILLLLAGIINLLLDAGLLTLNGIPHTDFFSE